MATHVYRALQTIPMDVNNNKDGQTTAENDFCLHNQNPDHWAKKCKHIPRSDLGRWSGWQYYVKYSFTCPALMLSAVLNE